MSRLRTRLLKLLPYRAWLQSTGTQYINTNLTLANTAGTIEIKFTPTEVATIAGSNAGYNGIVGENSNPQIGWCNKGWTQGNAYSTTPYAPEVGKTYTATWGYDTNAHIYIDGQDTGISRTGNLTVKLFYTESKPDNAKVKMHYCKITNTSGKITHYYVPCIWRRRTGLWDRVENKFYINSGSGKFIIEKGITSNPVFYDYMESTGTQYVDTTLTVTKSTGTFEIKFVPTAISGSQAGGSDYTGVAGINSAPQIGWYTGGWTVGNLGSAKPYMPEIGKTYVATWGYDTNEHLYIDGQDTELSRSGTLTGKICWVANGPENAKAKVYYCKITDINGNITHYFRPCVCDGATGLYDTVDKIFYENNGTDNFIMGNDEE